MAESFFGQSFLLNLYSPKVLGLRVNARSFSLYMCSGFFVEDKSIFPYRRGSSRCYSNNLPGALWDARRRKILDNGGRAGDGGGGAGDVVAGDDWCGCAVISWGRFQIEVE